MYSFPITDNEEAVRDLLEKVFDHLRVTKVTWQQPHIVFGGEGDSNQTEYERASNHLEIGVISSDRKVAQVLLLFLRFIIDRRCNDRLASLFDEEILIHHYGFDASKHAPFQLDMNGVVDFLAHFEDSYVNDFPLEAPLTRRLGIDTQVKTKLEMVDIWTLPRVELGIFDWI